MTDAPAGMAAYGQKDPIMAIRYIPDFLKHPGTPRVEHFAILAGLEASVRGMLISVMPLAVYDAVEDAGIVSRIYFLVGIASMVVGFLVPWATRLIPRRWMYSVGVSAYLVGLVLAVQGGPMAVVLALLFNALGTATIFVCFNAYVLDYIARADLGRGQSMQMLYAATPWAVGPMLGVWCRSLWEPLPFVVAAGFAATLLVTFWVFRLGNGKQIARAKGPAPNPVAYLGRFFRQPRLIAGWLFAVVRSCGWWVYVVYLPIFCIESGLGDKVGGIALSISNAALFVAPAINRVARRASVRVSVRMAFGLCGVAFLLATVLSGWPWASVGLVMLASVFLVTLDVVGGLPFLMAVKPSERTEMAAVYSSFRDVSGVLTPGAAYLVLLVAPLAGIFAAAAGAMGLSWVIAGQLHPRLGVARPSRGGAMAGQA